MNSDFPNFTVERTGTAGERTPDAAFKLAGSLAWVPGQGYFLYVRRRNQVNIG